MVANEDNPFAAPRSESGGDSEAVPWETKRDLVSLFVLNLPLFVFGVYLCAEAWGWLGSALGLVIAFVALMFIVREPRSSQALVYGSSITALCQLFPILHSLFGRGALEFVSKIGLTSQPYLVNTVAAGVVATLAFAFLMAAVAFGLGSTICLFAKNKEASVREHQL